MAWKYGDLEPKMVLLALITITPQAVTAAACDDDDDGA